jgi:hypothetical protein
MTMKIRIAFAMASCLLLSSMGVSQGPTAPSVPPEASQFDFLLGAWDLQVQPNIPNVPPRVRGRWTAQKSGDEFMVVDEYRLFDSAGKTAYLGETYRVYNSQHKQWEFRYVEPYNGTWHEGTGRMEGGEMHLLQKTVRPDGAESLLKIRYYNITADHFSWSSERSSDGGKTWTRGGSIEATRAK